MILEYLGLDMDNLCSDSFSERAPCFSHEVFITFPTCYQVYDVTDFTFYVVG